MPRTIHYCEVCGENLYIEEFPERNAIHVRPCTWCIDRARSSWQCMMDLFNGGGIEEIKKTQSGFGSPLDSFALTHSRGSINVSYELSKNRSLARLIHEQWLKHNEEGNEE